MPTFGYTTAGGTQDGTNEYRLAYKQTFGGSDGSTVDSYHGYHDDVNQGRDLHLGVYEHNSGDDEPEARKETVTGTGILDANDPKWYQIDSTSSPTLNNGDIYWIAAADGGAGFKCYYDSNGSSRVAYVGSGETSLPDPWGSSNGFLGWDLSVYITYTDGGGGATTNYLTSKLGLLGVGI